MVLWLGGGGVGVRNFQTKILINFLAKLGNSKHFSFFSKKKKKKKIGGGGNFQNIFPTKFLAKSGNSKHFSFFSFFSKKFQKKLIVVTFSAKIVDTLFPAISITHQGCACT